MENRPNFYNTSGFSSAYNHFIEVHVHFHITPYLNINLKSCQRHIRLERKFDNSKMKLFAPKKVGEQM